MDKAQLAILEYIWKRQAEFNANFHPPTPDQAQLESFTKDSVLSISSELTELINNITWKPHRNERSQVIASNIREELIDIFKFWNGLCLAWGLSPEDFLNEWLRKTEVVEQRFKQEYRNPWDPSKYKFCGIVDIDGVLCDYAGGLTRFVKAKTGVEIPPHDGQNDFYSHIAKYVGTEKAYELKHQFRETGEKLRLDPIPGAARMLRTMRMYRGYVLLLSARPYRKYKRIMADTLRWLSANGMTYHSIIWDEDKASRVVKEYPFASFIIEDDPNNARALAGKGFKVFLRNTSYNQHAKFDGLDVIRFTDYEELDPWLEPKLIVDPR